MELGRLVWDLQGVVLVKKLENMQNHAVGFVCGSLCLVLVLLFGILCPSSFAIILMWKRVLKLKIK